MTIAQRSLPNLGASALAAPAYRSHRSGCNDAEPVEGITKGTQLSKPASPASGSRPRRQDASCGRCRQPGGVVHHVTGLT